MLTNHAISDKDYEHVPNIWKDFETNIMKDYDGQYLKVDVLLLACMFENFKKESIDSFELCPVHYLSPLAYSWDAMLRFADVNLTLISDTEKYQFV